MARPPRSGAAVITCSVSGPAARSRCGWREGGSRCTGRRTWSRSWCRCRTPALCPPFRAGALNSRGMQQGGRQGSRSSTMPAARQSRERGRGEQEWGLRKRLREPSSAFSQPLLDAAPRGRGPAACWSHAPAASPWAMSIWASVRPNGAPALSLNVRCLSSHPETRCRCRHVPILLNLDATPVS